MLSGGTVDQFCEPICEMKKDEALNWHLKVVLLFFRFPPYLFRQSDHLMSEEPPKYRLCLAEPLLQLSYTTSWLPI